MKKSNTITFQVSGKHALFSDPLTKVGGEKCTYPIPTYQALKGILESCYWKPTLVWHIDRVRIMHTIHTQSKGIRPIKYNGGNELSFYTYLTDVLYQVEAHFKWNENRPELLEDRNEKKHFSIANRMIERGGRRDIFLGTRECPGYVEPCVFGQGEGIYDHIEELAFGVMFHSFVYPDENIDNQFESLFWMPKMEKGIITFCPPDACTMRRLINRREYKIFTPGKNFRPVQYMEEGEL